MAAIKIFLQYLILAFHFPPYICLDIIAVNQTFKEGDLLVSKNNKFAFGFFSPGRSRHRYLGIWFHKISQPSVVWVANRKHPINGSSGFLSVNQYGNLVLYNDPEKKFPLWSTNISGDQVTGHSCTARLLDSGNLILFQARSGNVLWQSFNYPTDTHLPGMKLGKNKKTGQEWSLTSWKSPDDPGIGEFSVAIATSNPLLQIFLYKGSKYLWRGQTWPYRKFSDVYSYKAVSNQEEAHIVHYITDDSIVAKEMVDHTGLFKWIRWSETDGQWKEFWSVPKNPCDLYAHCGTYGKCSPSNSDAFECSCLPGYEPRSPRDWHLRDASGGCVRKREGSSSFCRHGEGFLRVKNTKFPDTSSVALLHMNTSRLECERECLRNCSCTAYASVDNDESGNGCLTWYGELIDTMDQVQGGFDLYVRVDAIELAENTIKSNAFLRKDLEILILCITSAWLTIILLACLWIRRSKKGRTIRNKRLFDPASGSIYYKNTMAASELRQSSQPQDISFFDLSTILRATNNFSKAKKLGQGGFGTVYKGQLVDGQEVAVKRLSKNSGQGIEEFKNEVMLIAKLQHRNLVKLLGWCVEQGEQMLVYEYLPNKGLDSFLFGETRRSSLDWRKRFNIITGIARGILYLHQDSRLTIIHRDLKCSNILLDANMNPKISDFGMARIFKVDQIQEKTNTVVGTYGYMSPEYAVFGKFSVKSDVFSFGVILLEIVSAKKNNGFQEEDPSLTLIGYAWKLWRQDRVMEIVDMSMKGSYAPHEVLRCIQIGLLCVQENAMDRPTMPEVVLMLTSETAIRCPKEPAFIYRISSCNNSVEVGKRESSSVNDVTISRILAR